MTKCSALPRGFGTFPAGSAVRVKSRFALYSVSGAAFAVDRLAVRFAVVFVVRFAAVFVVRFVVVVALRFALVVVLRLAAVFALRFDADFLPRAVRDPLAVRLVAMRRPSCQEHASAMNGMSHFETVR
jgi:hypothetical protein